MNYLFYSMLTIYPISPKFVDGLKLINLKAEIILNLMNILSIILQKVDLIL